MRMRDILCESVQDIIVMNRPVKVLINPTLPQLLEFSGQNTMRGLVDDNGDTYWWIGRLAIHFYVAMKFGIFDPNSPYETFSKLEMNCKTNPHEIFGLTNPEYLVNSKSIRYLTKNKEIVFRFFRKIVDFDGLLEICNKHNIIIDKIK